VYCAPKGKAAFSLHHCSLRQPLIAGGLLGPAVCPVLAAPIDLHIPSAFLKRTLGASYSPRECKSPQGINPHALEFVEGFPCLLASSIEFELMPIACVTEEWSRTISCSRATLRREGPEPGSLISTSHSGGLS
jgi:hypothetical protein